MKSRAGHKRQYGACALHTGWLTVQANTHNMHYLLLFHSNNGYANAPQLRYTTCISCFVNICTAVQAGPNRAGSALVLFLRYDDLVS